MSAEVSLSKFEQRLATPDYATLPALEARFRKYASASANTAVGSGESTPEAVVPTVQELAEKIQQAIKKPINTSKNLTQFKVEKITKTLENLYKSLLN